MYNPVSTYRVQFHKGFTFKDFKPVIPYLHELGIKTIYASPIFEATPGSNHGYDIVNPHRINPEIGTLDELKQISAALKERNIGWLQDIVPNHMAFHPNNSWLMDVMEKGRESHYADFFDILWDVPQFEQKLMVPFLGRPLQEAITNGEVKLAWTAQGLFLQYTEQMYPAGLATYLRLFGNEQQDAPKDIRRILKTAKDDTGIGTLKDRLTVIREKQDAKKYIDSAIDQINKNPELLREIADEQHYRLSFWKDSDQVINYRRFFTVNGLICLNMQHETVYEEYHRFVRELLDAGIFQGLRVDHIDGLFNPAGYLARLRELAGDEVYIVVEKILESGEQFPANWPAEGNTGYDFLATVNNLLTSTASKKQFTDFYRLHIQKGKPVQAAILEKKSDILFRHMGGELENLHRLFNSLELTSPRAMEKLRPGAMKAAIAEFLIRCPVYRFYGNSMPLGKNESNAIRSILNDIGRTRPELQPAAGLLSRTFTGRTDDVKKRGAVLLFYQRCMQFTGPLMAKGVEDTLMYTYERFIGHNEVGDSPGQFGLKVSAFHQQMEERQARWNLSLNATSTHDTKRGEDARAKLNVLSDIGEKWLQMVSAWQRQNSKFKKRQMPDANDEYLIYQTLAGIVPSPPQSADSLSERLAAYLTKALREGKVHSQWADPGQEYEEATLAFAEKLLEPSGNFWKILTALQHDISDNFILNSLVQVLLKFTCPGTPDIYQGCELWDFSLVDPDNRRPVDFEYRTQQLAVLKNRDLKSVWENRSDGSVKLWLTNKLLQYRSQNAGLFAAGEYIPLQVTGKYKDHIIAFARRYLRNWLVVAAPLHLAQITKTPFPDLDWDDTMILLPQDAPLQWRMVLNDDKGIFNRQIPVKKLLGTFPAGLLASEEPKARSAGIIMHITSLPSRYGIGDLGPAARQFAEFLTGAHQRYWQMLPLNPTDNGAGYSPYSSFSSMAGNTLLISPDELVAAGWLEAGDIDGCCLPEADLVDFESALALKKKLFDIAYNRFTRSASEEEWVAYEQFKQKESFWLDDFALYETLKTHHGNRPWYEWDKAFKLRDEPALDAFAQSHLEEIGLSKWLQFVFSRQWTNLKEYGNRRGILFFGDIPFYVSYDSADVWTHPDIFYLDKEKNMERVAGVPPDYFNANGQVWGMPVYRWDKLKSTGYGWWVDRMKKNREYFDLMRLDHFRAFYDYWEIPAAERTAINGKWQPGPGTGIFEVFKEALGGLPFIAEDLGEISPGVYQLRDQVGLAGMNLLQYGFGDDTAVSVHVPHNHIVNSVTYTGTHDNNTTLGWFKENSTAIERRQLSAYIRTKVTTGNVSRLLSELCYASVSFIAMLPMQDVLGLDSGTRMNTPSSTNGNWRWQMRSKMVTEKTAMNLRMLVKSYNR